VSSNGERAHDGAADLSIVLPVGAEAGPVFEGALRGYTQYLDASERAWELVVVPASQEQSQQLRDGATGQTPGVRLCTPISGWGAAVIVGLEACSGEILCYTNWRRTSTDALSEMVELAMRNREVVLRANRRTRDTRVGRVGSLLYNLECRLLLNVAAWDVNGTPKIFGRHCAGLLELKQTGNLIDAEFAYVCERRGYPVIEVPVEAALRAGLHDALHLRAALRMYLGVVWLRMRAFR
jgi:hypothetical protein